MRNEELMLPENPFASPEEVTGEERRRMPERQALMLTQAGLGWMLVGAWCWMLSVVIIWVIILGVILSSSVWGTYHEPVSLMWLMWLLVGLLPVALLSSLPGAWRCAQGMGAGDDAGRAYIRISAICGIIGFLLTFTFWLTLVAAVLWIVSFWHWYRYLEYVAWKISRPNLARRAYIMILVVMGWLGLGLVTGAVGVLSLFTSASTDLGLAVIQLLTFVFCVLPGVYLGLEIWVLRGLRRGVEEWIMENG